jgi:ATP-binding cassette subfamily F protein uup
LEKGRQLSAAQFLEKFLFDRSMHYNFVHKLSGGEKRRLKLMTVLMANPNFLILDEPTNDLDIFVMSVLEDYLRTFEGCLIVVSHDRYFMDKMVDHLFVFEGDGAIKDIIGNYTEFRKQTAAEYKRDKFEKASTTEKEVKVTQLTDAVERTPDKRKLTFKEKEEFKQLENELESLEQEKGLLTTQLSAGELSGEAVMNVGQRLSEVVDLLEKKSDRWLELSEFV